MSAAPAEPQITAVVSVRPAGKRPKDQRAEVEIALVYDLAALHDVVARAALDQVEAAVVMLGSATATVRFRLGEPRT